MSSITASFQAEHEVRWNQKLLLSQAISIVWLCICGCFVWAIGSWWPSFFHHPNLTWAVQKLDLLKFWPLFAYAAVMAAISTIGIESTREDGNIFALDFITSILAGIWEELGYRWIFICTAMVGIVITNWILGTAVGAIIGIVAVLLGIWLLVFGWGEGNALFGLPFIAIGVLVLWFVWYAGYHDPLFWMYRTIIVPIVNVLTLGSFRSILYNPAIPSLFVFGMVAANANFRDGHKYQGFRGWLNAWIIGFVMMYAAITYGIGTAIVLHAVYDLEFAFVRYGKRKLLG